MRYNILSQILKATWLIDQTAAMAFMPVVANLIEGKTIDREESKLPDFVAASFSPTGKVSTYKKLDEAPKGSIAIIKVEGALMKADQDCGGPAGTATLGQRLIEADSHPNISGHILFIDSPGGTVDGTEEFAAKVKGAKKPVVTYVDGLMASAAYWIGSSSKEVIANGKSALIGSIGTMITLANFKNYFEQKGIKIHEVRADKSKDKNEAIYQAQEGEYKPLRNEVLNPLNEVFLSEVKSNRKGKLDLEKENTLTGKIYLAEDALAYGLIDSIGSFEYAIQRASELANENLINQTQTNMSLKNWFSGSAKTEAETIEVKTAELEQLKSDMKATQSELEVAQAQVADLTAKLKTANSTITTLNTEVSALTAERDDFKGKAEKYGSQPAAVSTQPINNSEEISSSEKRESWLDMTHDHNRTAAEMFKN